MSSRTRLVTATASIALVLAITAVATWGSTFLPQATTERPVEAPQVIQATVVRHTDGDTAHFTLEGGTKEKVRFIGIDTPEVGERAEPYGEEAAEYTASALPLGTTVWLEVDVEMRDRYGRLLAYVWLDEPQYGDKDEVRRSMLNARLILDGIATAYTYPPNVKYTDVFTALQGEARAARRGLWSE